MWVASKISGTAGALGAEEIDLINWLHFFGFALKELMIFFAIHDDWMANSSHPWAADCSLMACRLVALDKRPGVRPLVIGGVLRRALEKIVMRESG